MARPLVLLDSHAILHRAYHSLPRNLTDRQGRPINAVYGFARMVLKIIAELQPVSIMATFDLPAPTFRHEAFVGYQAHRPPMDDDLSVQIAAVKKLVDALAMPRYEKAGFEADDLIGTLARQAAAKKKMTMIVTGDRDILQLVSARTRVFLMRKGLAETEIMDRQGVKQLLGVWPEQVVDYKALVGDSSDNYPGVPGIGPKTAEKLLARFDTLTAIYAHLDEIEEKTATKLRENRSLADLSYRLAVIEQRAPVKLPKLEKWQFSTEKAREYLTQLGFKSLLRRLEKTAKPVEKKEQLRLV